MTMSKAAFWIYMLAILSLSSEGSGHSTCPQICPLNLQPVCGSDGKTYPNDCALKIASCHDSSIYKVSEGECEGSGHSTCPKFCPKNYRFVCGSDGKTYSNECTLKMAACEEDSSIYKVSEGRCGSGRGKSGSPCDNFCSFVYSPSCGSDGVTYANDCTFDIAVCKNPHLKLAHQGEC